MHMDLLHMLKADRLHALRRRDAATRIRAMTDDPYKGSRKPQRNQKPHRKQNDKSRHTAKTSRTPAITTTKTVNKKLQLKLQLKNTLRRPRKLWKWTKEEVVKSIRNMYEETGEIPRKRDVPKNLNIFYLKI